MITPETFWRENASMQHITPAGVRWPEGIDVHARLRELLPSGSVMDFGCGDGRMTLAFQPERYHGVDINPHAVARCRELYPEYRFDLCEHRLPEANAALCYTVLLHVPDDTIEETVSRIATASRVIVVEILGRKWRNPRAPLVFNREREDYERLFDGARMHLRHTEEWPYNRYGGTRITLLDFRANAKA